MRELSTTHIFTRLELAGDGAGPLVAVLDELSGGPLAVREARGIDLEPLGARGVELGAITIARSHVGGDWTHMICGPLRIREVKIPGHADTLVGTYVGPLESNLAPRGGGGNSSSRRNTNAAFGRRDRTVMGGTCLLIASARQAGGQAGAGILRLCGRPGDDSQ